MNYEENVEQLIENIDAIKSKLENDIQYAVIWLGESLDFLNQRDLKMALWSYSQFLQVLDRADIDLYKKTGRILYEKLEALHQEKGQS